MLRDVEERPQLSHPANNNSGNGGKVSAEMSLRYESTAVLGDGARGKELCLGEFRSICCRRLQATAWSKCEESGREVTFVCGGLVKGGKVFPAVTIPASCSEAAIDVPCVKLLVET